MPAAPRLISAHGGTPDPPRTSARLPNRLGTIQRRRTPISKQRNKHLQAALIEAAKVAPQWNPQLREVYNRAREVSNANQATLEVARKLVCYLLSVDRSRKPFVRRAVADVAGEGSTMAE